MPKHDALSGYNIALEQEKKAFKEERLALEQPVTDLITQLSFTGAQQDEVGAKDLEAFAKANRPELLALGVDMSSYARNHLMPKIAAKVANAQGIEWKMAPPKLLTGPVPDAALMPPPPPPAAAAGMETMVALPAEPESPKSDEGTPTKPAPKRSRRCGNANQE